MEGRHCLGISFIKCPCCLVGRLRSGSDQTNLLNHLHEKSWFKSSSPFQVAWFGGRQRSHWGSIRIQSQPNVHGPCKEIRLHSQCSDFFPDALNNHAEQLAIVLSWSLLKHDRTPLSFSSRPPRIFLPNVPPPGMISQSFITCYERIRYDV